MRNFAPHVGLHAILWFVLSQYVTSDCLLPDLDFPDGTYILPETYMVNANRTVVGDLSVLQFVCNVGYQLIGAEFIQCHDYDWTSEFPFCTDSKCSTPPSVENATYEVHTGVNNDTVLGSLAVYTCTEGYMLANETESTLECILDERNKTVSWLGERPVCKERSSCPDPGVSVNGERSGDCCVDGSVECEESGDACKVGDTLRYTCDDDFELVGNRELRCLPTGIWSSGRPKCRPLEGSCEFPPLSPLRVLRDNKEGDYFVLGEEAHLLCKPGYRCEGEEWVVCGPGGVWEKEFGVCEEIFCDSPPPLEHGFIPELEMTNQTIFPYDFDISYVCDEGYRIYARDSWRSCGKRGWSGRAPRCDVIRCPDPGNPENGMRIGSNFTIGSKVSFDCFAGYELLGSIEMYCLPNGQWSGEVARCDLPSNYCPDPGTPINGFKNMSQYQLGDKVGFRCHGKDVLLGSRVRECLKDTTWSGTQTRCVGKYDFDSKEQVRDLISLKIAEIREEQQRLLDAWWPWRFDKMLRLRGRIILYFAFDVSGSIGKINFDKSIAFAKALVRKVGITQNGARAGALTFSSKVDEKFLPLNLDTTEDVLEALDRIEYTGGGTAASSALRTIREEHIPLVKEWVGEEEIKSIIIILTDGRANMGGNPQTEAARLKKEGVEIYCIGITGDTNKNVMYDIASTSQYGKEKRPNVFMFQDYRALAWLVQEMTNDTIDYSECGLGQESLGIFSGRVVGGKESSDPWPWMAVLKLTRGKDINGSRTVKCGGSIIDRYLILTAAHCLFEGNRQRNESEVTVEIGFTVLASKAYLQSRSIRKFHMHPEYQHGNDSYDFDLALLELDEPIDYNAYVRPICLPPKVLPENSEFYKPNSIAWAIGFGHTGVKNPEDSSNAYRNINRTLKEILLPVRHRDVCLKSLQDNNKEDRFTDNMFCAGTEGKQDTCLGVSGGPVMQQHLNKDGYVRWVQVGVVSWYVGCGLKEEYGFYTHLQRLMPWLESKIETSRMSMDL